MQQLTATYRDIVKITLPISFSLLLPQVSFLVNTLFVAKLGQLPLVALGMVSVYYLLMTWICYGLSNGLLVLLSRKSGENNVLGYKTSFQNGLVIAVFLVAFLLLSTLLFGGIFYENVLSDTAVIQQSVSFLNIRIWGLPFLISGQILNTILISQNKTKWMILAAIFSNGVNILLDYVLIFGHWHFPNLGVNGAAYASIAAELVYAIVLVVVIYKLKIVQQFQLFQHFSILKKEFKAVLNISGPLMFQYIFSIGGWQIFFIYIEHLGQPQLAATHILRNILGLVGIGSWALASTSNTLVSNLIGQYKIRTIDTALKKLLMSGLLYGLFIMLILFVFATPIAYLFTADKEIIHFIKIGMTVLQYTCVLMCLGSVLFNAVIGIGNTKVNMIIEVSTVISYIIYITIIIRLLHGNFFWAWTSEIFYWGVLIAFSGAYYWRKKWENAI